MVDTGQYLADHDATKAAADALHLFHRVTLQAHRCQEGCQFFRTLTEIDIAFKPFIRDIHNAKLAIISFLRKL